MATNLYKSNIIAQLFLICILCAHKFLSRCTAIVNWFLIVIFLNLNKFVFGMNRTKTSSLKEIMNKYPFLRQNVL